MLKGKKIMNSRLDFKDLGFKLAVINELMYNKEVLEPKVQVRKFIAEKRNITESEARSMIEDEGYEIIPEIMEHFRSLEITSDMVQEIKALYTDGGDEIYLQIIPFWDGEDDVFNIKSAADAELLPNLKEVTIFFDKDESILSDFKNKGIKADWL